MKRDQSIDRIVKLVFLLSDQLAAIEGGNPNDLWPLHPDREATEPFRAAKPIMNEILDLVRNQNGETLSDDVILVKLLYGAAAIRMQIKITDHELEELARRASEDLVDYKAVREVDVPLLSLEVGEEPFALGPVTFHPISLDDKQTDWWKWARSTIGDSVDTLLLSYARVRVPGDLHKSIKNATALVNEALLLLRSIGFPLAAQDKHQFGILNEYPLWRNVPFRLGHPTETTRIDAQSNLVTTIGPFRFPYRLHEDILSKTSPKRLNSLLSLLARTGFAPQGEIQAKVLSGFRWLGEATKPDALVARFAKLAFSLEAFIGSEARDENLSTRGITAMLAERAAFLLRDDLETRIKVDKNVRDFYGKRSAIAHGRASTVNVHDFEEFGRLVRELGWSLIEKSDQFTKVDDLQRWVVEQRYSAGPSHPTHE